MVMVNAMPVGLSGVRALCRYARVPVVTHFPFIASFSRLPMHGVHSRVITRLQRLAGADVIIMPGFGDRMMTPEHEVLENVQACLANRLVVKVLAMDAAAAAAAAAGLQEQGVMGAAAAAAAAAE
jgi:ribulose 1,5-bisphosphate carboxylase large subunit-like protein